MKQLITLIFWAMQSNIWTITFPHQVKALHYAASATNYSEYLATTQQPSINLKTSFHPHFISVLWHIVQIHNPIRRHFEARQPFFWRRVWFGVWSLDHLSHPTHEWPFGFCSFSNLTEKDCQSLKAPDTPVSHNIYISINHRSLLLQRNFSEIADLKNMSVWKFK